ncbi:glycosyl hydrolase family 28-related protein [Paenibacillus eucommiae]|uniref:Rhamnogalacturonase A/B/Epimerase-like pectate lyase domain-containing protein n=1 Tax=Paenibacillus eucommiae TaxID=1355755 RepID=A0ABS4INU5_9BACL|nr:glycosyl hydrolase family 28-related protein [Paenibacillus eucommiae]MBP1988601.1 hypothetical protein [Paenibacillus eucommiae]
MSKPSDNESASVLSRRKMLTSLAAAGVVTAAGAFLNSGSLGASTVEAGGVSLRSDLADPTNVANGDALIAVLQPLTGAVARTQHSKNSDVIHVKDFGAKCDWNGTTGTDDTAAFQAALNAASSAASGLSVKFSGQAKITSKLTIPPFVTLTGDGRKSSFLIKAFNGDVIDLQAYGALMNLGIKDDTGSRTGRGVLITSAFCQFIFNCAFTIDQQCVDFTNPGAGSGAVIAFSELYSINAVGVRMPDDVGAGLGACPRKIISCESGGCILVDFGGCNDAWYYGGYTNGMIFGPNSTKAFISNVRIGAILPTIIKGGEHNISGCVFSTPVTFDTTSANCMFTSNIAPGYDITDNGIGNYIDIKERNYTPAWTGSSTNPSLGNGKLAANWSRTGNTITLNIELIIGSTTTLGSGDWRFSLPQAPYQYGFTKVGHALLSGPTGFQTATVVSNPELSYLTIAVSGGSTNVGPTIPFTWANGNYLRASISYQV